MVKSNSISPRVLDLNERCEGNQYRKIGPARKFRSLPWQGASTENTSIPMVNPRFLLKNCSGEKNMSEVYKNRYQPTFKIRFSHVCQLMLTCYSKSTSKQPWAEGVIIIIIITKGSGIGGPFDSQNHPCLTCSTQLLSCSFWPRGPPSVTEVWQICRHITTVKTVPVFWKAWLIPVEITCV